MPPDVSVLIVNWNTRDLLDRCLAAVYASDASLNLEVIVVDNASSDGSAEFVRQKYPQVRLIENAANVGFARANNQAMQAARGRCLLLLNSDAFVNPDTIGVMARILEAIPDTGAVGCKLFYEDGRFQPSAYSFPSIATELWQILFLDRLFPRSPIFGKYRMSYDDFARTRPVDWVMGACLMLRWDVYEKTGGFDEQYFMYSEETDLCYRIHAAGYQILYTPETSAVHIWGGSSRQLPEESFLILYRSRVLFFRKHYGRLYAATYKLVLALGSLARAAGGALIGLYRKSSTLATSAANYWTLLRKVRAF
jgi:GT2 family glycosyltransferase